MEKIETYYTGIFEFYLHGREKPISVKTPQTKVKESIEKVVTALENRFNGKLNPVVSFQIEDDSMNIGWFSINILTVEAYYTRIDAVAY